MSKKLSYNNSKFAHFPAWPAVRVTPYPYSEKEERRYNEQREREQFVIDVEYFIKRELGEEPGTVCGWRLCDE